MRVLLLALLAACGPSIAPLGTRVPIAELSAKRVGLDQAIADFLDRGEHEKAYFALDLRKTRPYAIQQLAALESPDRIDPALRDLRPLFARMLEAEDGGRAVQLVAATHKKRSPFSQRREDAYWKHVELFEARVSALNEHTPGLPFSYAARVGFGVSSMEETALLLGPREAFLDFFVHRDSVWGFLIFGGELVVKKSPSPAKDIARITGGLLASLRTAPTAAGDDDWLALAARAYDVLLAPFAPQLAEIDALLVSPDSFLANVPLAVLAEPAGGARRPLVERLRISYVASASVYRQLIARPILNDPPRLLAVGNASYPEQLAPLPFAEREAETVAELFPGSRLLRGERALESRIMALAPRYNILHFATHGVLLGRLLPDASSLLVSPEPGSDGFFNAAEIARLDLSDSYVAVLSACETSVATDGARSVDLGTLTNAFLGAGVPSVIGSLWQVSDEGTTILMLEFYRQFLEVGTGAALQRAMLAMRARPRFAHPYFWAPFALYGWDK